MIYLIVRLDCSEQSLHFISKRGVKFEFFSNNLYILIKKNDFLPFNDLSYEIMTELNELDVQTLQNQENWQKKILELLIQESVLTSGMIETDKFFHPGTMITHKNGILTQILTFDPGVNLKNKSINPTEIYLSDVLESKQFVGPLINIKNYTPQVLPYEQSLQYSFIALKKLINSDKITEITYQGSKKYSVLDRRNFFDRMEFNNKQHYQTIAKGRNDILDFKQKLFKNSNFEDFTLFNNFLNNVIQGEDVGGVGYVDLSHSSDVNSKLYAIRSVSSKSLWMEISKSLLDGTSQKSGILLKILL